MPYSRNVWVWLTTLYRAPWRSCLVYNERADGEFIPAVRMSKLDILVGWRRYFVLPYRW